MPRDTGGMSVSTTPMLLRNGRVLTPERTDATALLVVGETIGWIGSDGAAPAAARVVDLGGRLVTPGFVDAHVHLAKTGLAQQSIDLGPAGTVDEALDLLRAAVERSSSDDARDDLVLAYGWDETTWTESRPFTGAELADAVGGRAAYASRVDSHSAVVSPGLIAHDPAMTSAVGWSRDGRVERDAHHRARVVVDRLQTAERRLTTLRAALDAVARLGVTSVHDLNAPHISPADDAELIADLLCASPSPEVVSYWGAWQGGELADADHIRGFAGDLCIDGSLGSRTAAVVGGYGDQAEHAGHLYLNGDSVRDHVVWCTERGRQAGFHVIGDRGLEAFEEGLRGAADKLGAEAVSGARHRVEHVEMPSPALIEVMASLGVVASVQPAFDAAWGRSWRHVRGPRRCHACARDEPVREHGSRRRGPGVRIRQPRDPRRPLGRHARGDAAPQRGRAPREPDRPRCTHDRWTPRCRHDDT